MKLIARSTLIIAFFFGIDKILGFIRQVLVAREFGLTYEIDVFNAANNIPDLLSALISGGALGVALIPVLTEYLQKRGRPASWNLFSRILNLAFLVTGAFSVLIFLFAQPLVEYLIAPGFPPEQQLLTVELMRLDLVAIMIFSISGLVMAGLQANQHFLFPAMAPVMYNLGQIFGIAILAPEQGLTIGPITLPAFGMGIFGLVYGVIIGALLHLLIQVPGLIRYKFRWTPVIGLRTPGVIQVLHLLGPRVLTMFFLQVFFIARDNLASSLGEGAVTALNYGWFIMQLPETLIGTTLAIAVLPTLSEHISRGERKEFGDTVHNSVRILIAFTIPVAALIAITLPPFVRLVFDFDAAGTALVVMVSRAYLLGLTGHALLEISARSFYAQQDARTPLYVAALNAVMYVIIAISLSRVIGAAGIALANSISFTVEALILLFLLNRQQPGILAVNKTIVRVAVATFLILGISWLLLLAPLPPIVIALITLLLGGLAAFPFVIPEIRLLIKLQ
jgi:putative peptidoglycan lipid II flippase